MLTDIGFICNTFKRIPYLKMESDMSYDLIGAIYACACQERIV
jgi:hypothetical protein